MNLVSSFDVVLPVASTTSTIVIAIVVALLLVVGFLVRAKRHGFRAASRNRGGMPGGGT